MESELLKAVASQGVWAVLFVWLLLKTMKENRERESELRLTIKENQTIIGKLADSLNVVNEIKNDIEEIKSEWNRKD